MFLTGKLHGAALQFHALFVSNIKCSGLFFCMSCNSADHCAMYVGVYMCVCACVFVCVCREIRCFGSMCGID